jgi:hypothetical protein
VKEFAIVPHAAARVFQTNIHHWRRTVSLFALSVFATINANQITPSEFPRACGNGTQDA